jgi:hypothetical protein
MGPLLAAEGGAGVAGDAPGAAEGFLGDGQGADEEAEDAVGAQVEEPGLEGGRERVVEIAAGGGLRLRGGRGAPEEPEEEEAAHPLYPTIYGNKKGLSSFSK